MSKRQYLSGLLFASILGGLVAIGAYQLVEKEQPVQIIEKESQPVLFSNYPTANPDGQPVEMNFVDAAKAVTPGVVHIRSTKMGETATYNPLEDYFREFFGEPRGRQYQQRQRPSVGTGSGVIISNDGYIATNNHVIDGADEIEILLNDNRTFEAKVVGTDPTTDLALLKIESKDLPTVRIGNSDNVEVGEWVLAVGNPFEFRSTVTAGIISAKGRNINILRDRSGLAIESFLQTDAAVNPGNSGGALVNTRGELVGINTAIATHTGSYEGYSFAVPANLVNKVVGDLKEFGVVQRALLGISIRDVNADLAEEEDLGVLEGVYVQAVKDESSADDAGIKKGDVIIAINGQEVKKTAELQEKVALNRPGDKVSVTIVRDGREKTIMATLKNTLNTTKPIASNSNTVIIQGATFEDLSKEESSKLGVSGGAKIVVLEKGKWKDAGIKEGFVVTGIDKKEVNNVEELSRILSARVNGSGLLIEGIYPSGMKAYYGIGW